MKRLTSRRLLAPLVVVVATSLACATSATPPPDTSARATSLQQTVESMLTSTAVASITPVTPTLPPTDTAVAPTATDTQVPTVAPTTPVPTPTFQPCEGEEDSGFVTDVTIPDRTHMAPGTAFNKTWQLRNDGDCTWTTAYQIRYISGDEMSGAPTNLPNPVPPGGTVDITVALIAPSGNGTFKSTWQLFTPDGVAFGTKPYVEIIVP